MTEKIGRNEPCSCGSGRKYKKCCVIGETPPDSQNGGLIVDKYGETEAVAGVMFNLNTKQRYVITKSLMMNQIRRDAPKIAKSFDVLCAAELEQISSLFSTAYFYISAAFLRSLGKEDRHQHLQSELLMNASTSCLAALELLRSGYALQTGILVRHILETIAVALHLTTRPGDFILTWQRLLWRVQVKSLWTRKPAYRLMACGSRDKPYTPEQVDFFVVYIGSEDLWYIMPISAVISRVLYLAPRSHTSRFIQYIDAWGLFRGEQPKGQKFPSPRRIRGRRPLCAEPQIPEPVVPDSSEALKPLPHPSQFSMGGGEPALNQEPKA